MMCEQSVPSFDSVLEKAKDEFFHTFQKEPRLVAWAPAKVNLMGDHMEFNQGFVLPMALPFVTVIVGRPNKSHTCRMISLNKDDSMDNDGSIITFRLPSMFGETLGPDSPQWANYIRGVIAGFPSILPGFDILINSSVPVDCGLGSSASLEIAMFTFLEEVVDIVVDPVEKALICQRGEKEVVGLPCGFTDQLVSVVGKADHVILIDCQLLEAKLIPFTIEDLTFVITDTNVRHKASCGANPKRQRQCQRAATLLGEPSLRFVEIDELVSLSNLDVDIEMVDRARHVIMENIRVVDSTEAIENGDYKKFGELMFESHESLRDLYGVSCDELDTLVAIAKNVPGVLGSRMSGEGFGGCTITLVHKDAADNYMRAVLEDYENSPTFYVCRPGDGSRSIKLNKKS